MNKEEIRAMLISSDMLQQLRTKFIFFADTENLSKFIVDILAPLLIDNDDVQIRQVIDSVLAQLTEVTYGSRNFYHFSGGFKAYLTNLIAYTASNHLQQIKIARFSWIDELLTLDLNDPEKIVGFLNNLINYAASQKTGKDTLHDAFLTTYFTSLTNTPVFMPISDEALTKLMRICKIVDKIERPDLSQTAFTLCTFAIKYKALYVYNQTNETQLTEQNLDIEREKYLKDEETPNKQKLPYGKFNALNKSIMEKLERQTKNDNLETSYNLSYAQNIIQIEKHLDNITACANRDMPSLVLAYVKFGEYLQKTYGNLSIDEIILKLREFSSKFVNTPLPDAIAIASLFRAVNYLHNYAETQANSDTAKILDALTKALYGFNTLKGAERLLKEYNHVVQNEELITETKFDANVASAIHFIKDDIVPNTKARHEVDDVISRINTFSQSLSIQKAKRVTEQLAWSMEHTSDTFFALPNKNPQEIASFKKNISEQVHEADLKLSGYRPIEDSWKPIKQNALSKIKNLVIYSMYNIKEALTEFFSSKKTCAQLEPVSDLVKRVDIKCTV